KIAKDSGIKDFDAALRAIIALKESTRYLGESSVDDREEFEIEVNELIQSMKSWDEPTRTKVKDMCNTLDIDNKDKFDFIKNLLVNQRMPAGTFINNKNLLMKMWKYIEENKLETNAVKITDEIIGVNTRLRSSGVSQSNLAVAFSFYKLMK